MIHFSTLGQQENLGHQLFGYAALKAIAKETSLIPVLPNQLLSGDRSALRLLALNCLEAQAGLIYQEHFASDPLRPFDLRAFEVRPGTDLHGAFASFDYADRVAESLRAELKPVPEWIAPFARYLQQLNDQAGGRIKVWVDLPFQWAETFDGCTPGRQYFERVMRQFDPDAHVFVLPAHGEAFASVLPGVFQTVCVPETPQAIAMLLGAACDHHICSRSTTGWWAAWLGTRPDQRVFIPDNLLTEPGRPAWIRCDGKTGEPVLPRKESNAQADRVISSPSRQHIVMTWELGEGLGHLIPLKNMAARLIHRGHDVTLIAKEVTSACRVFGALPVRLLQSPLRDAPRQRPLRQSRSFADILQQAGWDQPESLRAKILAWRSLFERLRPNTLVFDHSPTALLASRDLDAGRVLFGTSFTCQPFSHPLPAFIPDVSVDELIDHENQIVDAIHQAIDPLFMAPLVRLGDLYGDVDHTLIRTRPEVDVFSSTFRVGRFCGIHPAAEGDRPVWPDQPGRKIFVYVRRFKALASLFEILQASQQPCLVYAPELPPDWRYRFEGKTLRFSSEALDMNQVASHADAAVLHGGCSTTMHCLRAGVPMMLIPTQMEQRLNARCYEALGVARMGSPDDGLSLLRTFREFLLDTSLANHAKQMAAKLPVIDSETEMEWATERIEATYSVRRTQADRPVEVRKPSKILSKVKPKAPVALFAWELGAGLGHLAMLNSIAEPLVASGIHVVIAARDLRRALTVIDSSRIELVQSPVCPASAPIQRRTTTSLADILYNTGFGDAATLSGLVRAWQDLFALISPSFLLVDHSPAALLAARSKDFPVMQVGNGFFSPPHPSPIPVFDLPGLEPTPDLELEAEILANTNAAIDVTAGRRLAQLSDLYHDRVQQFLTTVPELDHHGPRQDATYTGVWTHRQGKDFRWPSSQGPRVFVYLENKPASQSILSCLNAHGCSGVVYANQWVETARALVNAEKILISDQPLNMNRALQEADLVITHGCTTAEQALQAGVPVLRVPLHHEQSIHAQRCVQTGASLFVLPEDSDGARRVCEQMLRDPGFQQAAGQFAQRNCQYHSSHGLTQIVEAIRQGIGLTSGSRLG